MNPLLAALALPSLCAWATPDLSCRRRRSFPLTLRISEMLSCRTPVLVVLALSACAQHESPDEALTDELSATRASEEGPISTKEFGTANATNRISFCTDEATWMNVDLSPDGRTMLIDILGEVHSLPATGGRTTRLWLPENNWDHSPRYSPDGSRIAFIRDSGNGEADLWLADVDGTNPHLVARGPLMSPVWLDDNEIVALSKIGGELQRVSTDGQIRDEPLPVRSSHQGYLSGPAKGASMAELIFSAGNIYRWNANEQTEEKLTSGETQKVRPKLSPDGSWLVFGESQPDGTIIKAKSLVDGSVRVLHNKSALRTQAFRAHADFYPDFTFTPDSRFVIVAIDGGLKRIEIQSGSASTIHFSACIDRIVSRRVRPKQHQAEKDVKTPRHLRWTNVLAGQQEVIFSAIGSLWRAKLGDGSASRLTDAVEREYAPSVSRDARDLVYVSWTDEMGARLMLDRGSDGTAVALTAGGEFLAGPAWSNDKKRIAFISGPLLPEGPNSDREYVVEILDVESKRRKTIGTYDPLEVLSRVYPDLIFSQDDAQLRYLEGAGPGLGKSFVSIELATLRKKRIFRVAPSVDSVELSPDERHLLVGDRNDIWLRKLGDISAIQDSATIDLHNPKQRQLYQRLSLHGASYAEWLDNETVAWSFLNRVYKARIDQTLPDLIGTVEVSAPPTKEASNPVAIVGARAISMKGDAIFDESTVLVSGRRIVAVGPMEDVAVPADAVIVDARGKTIIPGLIDTHGHLFSARAMLGYWPETRHILAAYLAYGVTTSYDPSAPTIDAFAQAEMIDLGLMIGPRVISSGQILYGHHISAPFASIADYEDAETLVDRLVSSGATLLKSYHIQTRQQQRWIVEAARERGVGVTVEGYHSLVRLLKVVVDGHTSAEHFYVSSNNYSIYDDVAQFVAQSGIHWNGTILARGGRPSAFELFKRCWRHAVTAKDRRFLWPTEYPEPIINYYDDIESGLYVENCDNHAIVHRLGAARGMAALLNAGAKVDVGSHGNIPGLGTHWEMWTLAMGGSSAHDVLRAATLTGAEKIGWEASLGSIEEGKLADFIVLNSNPLDDIRNSLDIAYIVKDGVVFDASDLGQIFPNSLPGNRPFGISTEHWVDARP